MIDPLSPKWLNKLTIEVHEIVIYCARSIKPRNVTELKVGIHKITGAHVRTVQHWFAKGIDHEKGKFQPSHFQSMVEYLFQEKLITKEEVYSFASKLGDDFELELNQKWAQLLFFDYEFDYDLPLPSDERYPKQFISIDTSTLHEVEEKIVSGNRNVLIIHGKPGTGKTTLISQLEQSTRIAQIYGENILSAYLGGKTPEYFYRSWLKQIDPVVSKTIQSQNDRKIPIYLNEDIKKKSYLLLVDDISSVDFAEKIILIDFEKAYNSKIVITTSKKEVVKKLTILYDADLIEYQEFSLEETKQLFQIIVGKKIDKDHEHLLSELRTILHGNPLGLHISFKQLKEYSLERFIELLNQFDLEIPRRILKDVFLPLQIAYERLDKHQKEQFIRLGSLPILRNYCFDFIGFAFNQDGVHNPIITEELIKKLNDETGIFSKMDSEERTLEIHSQIIIFAQSLSGEEKTVDYLKLGLVMNLDKKLQSELVRLKFVERAKLSLGVGRPRKFTPNFKSVIARVKKILDSPNNLTQWEIVSNNLPLLTSSEYIFSYRLFQKEAKERYWIYSFCVSVFVGLRLSFTVWIMGLLQLFEFQTIGAYLSTICFFYSIFSCLIYAIVNVDNILKWNWLFTRIKITIPNYSSSNKMQI